MGLPPLPEQVEHPSLDPPNLLEAREVLAAKGYYYLHGEVRLPVDLPGPPKSIAG